MTDKQVIEYIDLIHRRMQILINSGVSWKPEYTDEMKRIDARITELLPLVEEMRKEKSPEPVKAIRA